MGANEMTEIIGNNLENGTEKKKARQGRSGLILSGLEAFLTSSHWSTARRRRVSYS